MRNKIIACLFCFTYCHHKLKLDILSMPHCGVDLSPIKVGKQEIRNFGVLMAQVSQAMLETQKELRKTKRLFIGK